MDKILKYLEKYINYFNVVVVINKDLNNVSICSGYDRNLLEHMTLEEFKNELRKIED